MYRLIPTEYDVVKLLYLFILLCSIIEQSQVVMHSYLPPFLASISWYIDLKIISDGFLAAGQLDVSIRQTVCCMLYIIHITPNKSRPICNLTKGLIRLNNALQKSC